MDFFIKKIRFSESSADHINANNFYLWKPPELTSTWETSATGSISSQYTVGKGSSTKQALWTENIHIIPDPEIGHWMWILCTRTYLQYNLVTDESLFLKIVQR